MAKANNNKKEPKPTTYKKLIGVVIDASHIIAAEVSGTKANPIVNKTAAQYLPKGLVENGVITDADKVGQILQNMLKTNGFSGAPIVVAAKGQNLIMRIAPFPKVADDKIKAMIAYGAQQVLPVSVADLVIDSVICEEFTEDNKTMISALIVGARKLFLESVIKIADSLNTVIAGVDAAPLAALKSTEKTIPQEKATLFAYIDYETISMVIMLNDAIKVTRTVAIADTSYNRMLEKVEITPEKYWQGVIETQDLAHQVMSDIRTSINFFQGQNSNKVEQIILCGENHALEQVAQAVEAELDIPVTCPQPYANLLKQPSKVYSTAISMAINGLEE